MMIMEKLEAGSGVFELITNPAERAVFVLHFYWGFTYQEIAICFGTSEEAVAVLVKSARDQVKFAGTH